MVGAILGGIAVLSAAINVWQCLAAASFAGRRRIVAALAPAPGVSVLKPLKGADAETESCLKSWIEQDYTGVVQILLGVANPSDPVCEIVRNVQRTYPERSIELVICNPILGLNAKVSTLADLEQKAIHPIWIISDADVFAPVGLLTDVTAAFREDEVALVNCFYRLPPKNAAMLWESIAVNSDFWSQVCQSNSMQPMKFALGAVMAVRRGALEKIGGFKPLLNHLADDYQLGRRISDSGGKIVLSNLIVECRESSKTFAEVWRHQLRWARTIRVCQAAPYFFSILSNVTLWVLLYACANGWTKLATTCLTLRIFTALINAFLLENPAPRNTQSLRGIEAVFAPLKDILQFFIWLCAFGGNSVIWRGEEMRVNRGGELVRIQG